MVSHTTERELLELENKKVKKWNQTGKGKGNRWLMLRDLLAVLSLRPMTMSIVQDTLFLMRGLKRSTVRDMIEQLERTKSVSQVRDVSENTPSWFWVATEEGVLYWIGSRKDIPATIVTAAHTIKSVNVLEE